MMEIKAACDDATEAQRLADDQREFEIRRQNGEAMTAPPGHHEISFVLRRLDHTRLALSGAQADLALAREEIEGLKADAENDGAYRQSLKASISQICDAIGIERGSENWKPWIERVRAEIAALRAPLPSDAMEIARDAYWEHYAADIPEARIMPSDGRHPVFVVPAIARALAAARADERAKVIEECAAIAKAARSEAELEKQAATASAEGKTCWLWAFDTANAIERDIRALADRIASEGTQHCE